MNRAGAESTVPREVAAVHKAAKESAKRGGLRDDTAGLYQHPNTGRWEIADNYERYSPAIIEYEAGQWTIRMMYSEAPAQRISYQDALQNAHLMFSDQPSMRGANRSNGGTGAIGWQALSDYKIAAYRALLSMGLNKDEASEAMSPFPEATTRKMLKAGDSPEELAEKVLYAATHGRVPVLSPNIMSRVQRWWSKDANRAGAPTYYSWEYSWQWRYPLGYSPPNTPNDWRTGAPFYVNASSLKDAKARAAHQLKSYVNDGRHGPEKIIGRVVPGSFKRRGVVVGP